MKLIGLIIAINCFTWPTLAAQNFFYDIFADQAKCDDAISFGVNCYQDVLLKDDGTARVILTDIVNVGTYKINGDNISIQFEGASEIQTLNFTFSSNKKFLIEDGTTKVWEPVQ